ncbi:hypothetical protein ACVWYN_002690 [Pedobacter sp. UYP24]
MKVRSLASILYFDFDGDIKVFILGVFTITKSPQQVARFLQTQKIDLEIGKIGMDTIYKSYTAYIEGDTENFDAFTRSNNSSEVAHSINGCLNSFLLFNLWFLKDCSVYCLKNHLFNVDTKAIKIDTRDKMISNSSGLYQTVKFSAAELSELALINELMLKYQITEALIEEAALPVFDKENFSLTSRANYLAYNSNINRIIRALLFLFHARSNSFLPQKISFYIAILEALFTIQQTGVTKQITERTAFYLGGDESKIQKTYELVNKAYKVRSQYVHGQPLKNSYASIAFLLSISKDLDEILRIIFNKVLKEDSEKFKQQNEHLMAWFKTLVKYDLKPALPRATLFNKIATLPKLLLNHFKSSEI